MQVSFQSPNFTQAPNDFFDDLLKEIDEISELKVTLAAIRQTFGYHREAAEMSISWFEMVTGLSRNSVRRGIEKAIERGTLTKVKDATARDGAIFSMVVIEGQPLTPRGSTADPLEGQPLTPLNKEINTKETSPAAANGKNPPDRPTPYQTWESVGLQLSPYIAERLKEFEKDYTSAWVIEAIKRAARTNKRNLAYIEGILKRWAAAGVMDAPALALAPPPVLTEQPDYQRNIKWAT